MPAITTGLANLLIVLAVGIAAGLLFNRYGQTWLRRANPNPRDLSDRLEIRTSYMFCS
jgi:hypothetical protein